MPMDKRRVSMAVTALLLVLAILACRSAVEIRSQPASPLLTPLLTATSTPEPRPASATATLTSEPTAPTATPTATPTDSPTATATDTQTPTATPTARPTHTPTLTDAPTAVPTRTPTSTTTHTPTPTPTTISPYALLSPMSHEWQKMNNCAPATLAMTLSYYGYELTQFDLAPLLRGSEEDKHVSPEEIVTYARKMGLGACVRVNGQMGTLQRVVAAGVPAIVEQWLDRPNHKLTGHYRLVRGYDREAQTMIVNDSYSGPALQLSYAEFDRLWRAFNRTYIPVYPVEMESLVAAILGEDWDDQRMWLWAIESAQAEVQDKGDLYAWFNLGSSYMGLGMYEMALGAYEQAIGMGLPPRMLWYQPGPLEALNRARCYSGTLELTEPLVTIAGLEEIRYERGLAYEGLGHKQEALAEYRLALQYNPRWELAQEALRRLEAGDRQSSD